MEIFYYAYLDANDICTQIYALPAQITGEQFIQLDTNDTTRIGKHYNRTLRQWETAYYYAVLNEKNIVSNVEFKLEPQTTSATYREITFAQYQTVTGLYWNGTDYVTPPIHIAAKASTNEINYKDQDKWLSTKLDEMDADIDANEDDISTISTSLSTVVSSLTTISNNLAALATVVDGKANTVHSHTSSAITGLDDALTTLDEEIEDLQTAVNGKANASHTHTASDLSGVVKTVNGNAPDASGNITVTSGGMTATEILTAIETVDGSGSGLDADKLDGMESTYFATADHVHVGMVTNDMLLDYAQITAVNTALAGKSDVSHNHDATYAPISHVHSQYLTGTDIESFEFVTLDDMTDALAEKSDTSHNHDTSYATINHTHSQYLTEDALDDYATTSAMNTALASKAASSHTHAMSDVTGLATALSGKSDSDHNHDTAYAAKSHTHTIANVTGLSDALDGKASSTHNHNSAYAAISHSHDIADVTGLSTALSGKSSTSHNHDTVYAPIEHSHSGYAATNHTHAQYLTEDNLSGYATTSALANKSDITHNHDESYAGISHTHSNYATTSALSALQETVDGKAEASHTHSQSNITGLVAALDGKADVDHTHTGYATTTALNSLSANLENKANSVHTHSQSDVTGLTAALSGKANSSHTHAQSDITGLSTALAGKANSSHTHSNYYPTTGGTISGDVAVTGLIRVGGQQSVFNSGSTITLASNNLETMIAGSKIFSKVAISTSSDSRLKENVQTAPIADLISMVQNLDIKKFNYIGNSEQNIGIIAQDFIADNPNLTQYFIRQCCDDGMYSFKDTELVYALVAAVQDIYSQLANNSN